MVEKCHSTIEKRLSANQRGCDDANVIFGRASTVIFRICYRIRLQWNYANIETRSEFLSA